MIAARCDNRGAQPFRLARGGRIDRSRILRFSFDGRRLTGHPGDTLASALLANGVRVVARSIKFHRPRGVMSAGVEEPSAIVTVGRGAYREPNIRATQQPLYDGLEAFGQNAWPSVHFDCGRCADALHSLFAAGFFNKTCMWPRWSWYQGFVRRAAGLGQAPCAADPDVYVSRHASCDVLVVGGGRSGLRAALAAARAGKRVVLAEKERELGGALLWERTFFDGLEPEAYRERLLREVAETPGIRVITDSCVAGAYDHGLFLVEERLGWQHGAGASSGTLLRDPRVRAWKLRAAEVILATGAIEQPLTFPYNDRPGIMLAGAVRRYLNQFAVVPGRRVVVATNNDDAYLTALDLHATGVQIAAILDTRETSSEVCRRGAAAHGIRVICGAVLVGTHGSPALRSVDVEHANEYRERLTCDCLAVSGGWNPALDLLAQARGRVRFDSARRCFAPDELPAGWSMGEASASDGIAASGTTADGAGALDRELLVAVGDAGDPRQHRARAWLDFAHDVTAQDLDIAVRENFVSIEHLKRYTTTGMSLDQGKTSNLNTLVLLARKTKRTVDETGTTTFRPMFTPVTLGAIAGGRRGCFYHIVRELPSYAEQLTLGATLEDMGGWLRPVAYPRRDESEEQAVRREVRAVRTRVGLFEASPLGKILVRGPDAAELVERVYANTMRTLPVGRIRYGIMLNEKGAILDDGVCARFAEHEFWISATSGNAARIALWLEEWLQGEWLDLCVTTTAVTDEWATLTVSGPRASGLMRRLPSDLDFSRDSFPHMHAREGKLAGIETRVLRVSFTGEPTYEINVPSDYAASLWRMLMDAGEHDGIQPFGIEALQTLRVEKGHIHVGMDTDGTTIPADIGFGDPVARKTSDFIGRRSLLLAENRREGRLQLVGLIPRDRSQPLVAGAHLVTGRAGTRSGIASEGYVTSARFSPMLGHYIALGLLARGRARHGTMVRVFSGRHEFEAEVVPPAFYDPMGRRLDA